MAYDKYKKIKNNPRSASSSGLRNADNYVDDEEKTREKGAAPEKDEAVLSIAAISAYAENEMKVINPENYRSLVTGVNCSASEFVSRCTDADRLYHLEHDEHLNPGQSANQGFHVINSFHGHPDPELVHRAGLELARRLCGDDFYGKVCTHLNTDNYHNHIVIGAYAIDGTRKFRDEWHLYRKIRQISNEISLEYGLDIIVAKGTERQSWSETFQHERKDEIHSVTRELKENINEARKNCADFNEFINRMKDLGWDIQEKKNVIVYSKDSVTLSDSRLGNRYTKRGIEESIARDADYTLKRQIAYELRKQARREEWKQQIKVGKIYVPRYSKNGFRLPALIRLLILIKLIIQKIGDQFFNQEAAEKMPGNLRTASAAEKIAKIDEAIELCAEYGISTRKQLGDMLFKVGMNSKAKDYEAARLYQAVDLMGPYIDDLSLYDDLKIVTESLGIEESDFGIPYPSDEEIAGNRAALDPMGPKLKKQLFNSLSDSEYALPRNSFKTLTRSDAEAVLDFLAGRTDKKPDILLDKASAELLSARNNISKRLAKRNEMLFRKYHSEPASSKQIDYISRNMKPEWQGAIDLKHLKKDQAIRIMQQLNLTPPTPNYTEDITRRPNDYLKNSIRDLKLLFPELQGIDEEKLTAESANKISNYYLSRQDDLLAPAIPAKKKAKKINLSSYSEEEKKLIYRFRNLLDVTHRFGLKTSEDVHAFIEHYNDIQKRADNLSAESRDYSYDYRELKNLERILKQLDSPAFVYGTMYEGKAEELKASLETIDEGRNDDLIFLRDSIPKQIDALKKRKPQPETINSELYSPPDFVTMNILIRLRETVPQYFKTTAGTDINLQLITELEALTILEQVQKSKVLDKEIEKLEANERKEDEQQQEKADEQAKEIEERTEKEIEQIVEKIRKSRHM